MRTSANFTENPLNITILESLINYQLKWMKTFESWIKGRQNNVDISSMDQNNDVEILELYINGCDDLMGILKSTIQEVENRVNNEEIEFHRNTVHTVKSAAQNQVNENAIEFQQQQTAVDMNENEPHGSRSVNNAIVIRMSEQTANKTGDDASQYEQAQIIVPAGSIDKECSMNESCSVQEVDCTAIQEVNHNNHEEVNHNNHEALHTETNDPSSNATPKNDDALNQTQGSDVENEKNPPAPSETRTFAIRRKYFCAFNESDFIGRGCRVILDRLEVDRNSISARDRNGDVSAKRSYNDKSTDDIFENMELHRGQHLLVCYICNKRFTALRELRAHLEKHGPRKLFSCEVCAKVLSASSSLKCHLRLHTGEKPFACKICGRKFEQSGQLTYHLRLHTGERPFACKVCGKQFRSLGTLTNHLRVHTGEKPFSCKVCDKQFSSSSKLTGHLRVHTGEKPFSCKICGKQFRSSGNLTSHVRVHTGEKPVSCKI